MCRKKLAALPIKYGIGLLFVTVLLGAPLGSRVAERWTTLRRQAVEAAQRGSFAEAESLLRLGLESLPNDESAAAVVLWNEIGSVHQSGGQVGEAEKDFERALQINARLPKPDEGETAVALNDLATIAGARRDTVRAEKLLREAYRELEKVSGTEGPTAALVTGNLALTLQQEGRYAEAVPLYERAFVAIKSQFGENSIEYARTAINLAALQFERGAYRQAVENGELARSIESRLPYVTNLERALMLNNLGMALKEVGSLAEARSTLLEAIRIELDIPDGKTQLVFSLNNLGEVEQQDGQLQAAKEQELKVLALKAEGFPVPALTLASALNTLGRIATKERSFKEAAKSYARACELLETTSGPSRVQYAATLSNMGALKMAERHYREAEILYRKALAIDEAQLGANHPTVASDESNIAAQLFYQRRTDEALELYEKTRSVVEASFGPVSLEMAQLWRNIAIASAAEKDFARAVSAYSNAVEALDGVSANNSGSLSLWLHEYAGALRKEQRWGEAEAAETRALGIEIRNVLAAQKQKASVASEKRPAKGGS
jgi:tetratricopeptide (TPR) repeat protein